MALTTTTLSSAATFDQNFIVVTSATGFAAGNWILCDQEQMRVLSSYVSGTTIPVVRGQAGTASSAHVVTSNVTTYLGSDTTTLSPQTPVPYPVADRGKVVQSITATSTLVLPAPNADLMVVLNGTSVITLTVPLPTKDMDGTVLYIVSNGAAAHVITFTSTLNNAGSGYTSFTNNSSGTMALMVFACNGFWTVPCFPAWTGTVTKVTGGIA